MTESSARAYRELAKRITAARPVKADAELIQAAALHLAAIVESSEDAIVSKTLDGVVKSWNDAAQRMFGYAAEEIVGKSIRLLIPLERQHEEDEILDRIRRGERVAHFETVRQAKDGRLVEVSLTISPVKDESGKVVGASKIARDISETKKMQQAMQEEIEQRRKAEAGQQLLLNEIKHRVKNTLTTVQALASQSFKRAPKDEREAFTARILTLSNAHDLLTQKNWNAASVAEASERAIQPFADGRVERIKLSGPEAQLAPNKVLLLSMLLHELGTNALKYGALSNSTGSIRFDWGLASTQDDKPALRFHWQESGGPPVKAPSRKGFGSRLLERALAAENGCAELEFEPVGLHCTFMVPLDP